MLDSFLTLSRGESIWLASAFILAVIFNRAITIMTGREEPIFLVVAVVILAILVVKSVYTAAKWVWHRLRGESGSPKA